MNQHQHHNTILKVAVMADVHAHDTSRGSFEQTFAEINSVADVLVLCGDITNTGNVKEAEHLMHDLRVCTIPIVAVLGNHDYESNQVEELKNILKERVIFLEHETFVKDHVGFAGTKGFGGGFDNFMLSAFGEPATKEYVNNAVNESFVLEKDLRSLATPKIIAVLHYSPIEETVRGEPKEIYPFLGCSRLAETIDRFPITFVVHGHAHNGHYEGKTHKGIPVYNCAQEIMLKKFGKPYALFEV